MRTQVEPVPSAGVAFIAIWLIGQFQGVIRPKTPIDSRSTVSLFLAHLYALQGIDEAFEMVAAEMGLLIGAWY